MEKENGIYKIPCKVNGINMNFVLDTGASDVLISITEAKFLAKQGLLSKDDILGSKKYLTADGTITEGTKIILKEIKIKDIFITDVQATVINNENAPLLLGQSALSKFGSFEIEGDYLRIYPNGKRSNYTFLGIDLTKEIDDFGLSRVNLGDADPFLPISFEACNVSKSHELLNVNFDNQLIIFNKKGRIAMVSLHEEADTELNGYEREEYTNYFFERVIEKLASLYGMPDEKMTNVAKWINRDYEIILSQSTNDEVFLIYQPKILIDSSKILELNSKTVTKSSNKKEIPKEVDESFRSHVANKINSFIKNNQLFKDLNFKCSTESENLYFYFENDHSEYLAHRLNSKNKNTLKNFGKETAFILYEKFVAPTSETQDFNSDIFSNIVFDFYWSFSNGENFKFNVNISSQEMKRIGYPVSKYEFTKYLD